MAKTAARATLRVIDHDDVAGAPLPDDFAKLSAPLTSMLTCELDEAKRYLRVATEELLVAALGRTLGRTLGAGEVAVDVMWKHRLSLGGATGRTTSATRVLRGVRHAFTACSPTSLPADVMFSYVGRVPPPAYRQGLPNGGHTVELRTYREKDRLQMDWWYDARRLDRTTVEELTEQFPLALIELTSEALPIQDAAEITMADEGFALADS